MKYSKILWNMKFSYVYDTYYMLRSPIQILEITFLAQIMVIK